MKLDKCPKCGCDSIAFSEPQMLITRIYSITFKRYIELGRPATDQIRKIEALCNRWDCDQKFWYYLHTGRITRRNK